MTRVRSIPWAEVPQVWTPAAPDPSWGLRELVAPGGFDGSAVSGVAPAHGGSGGVDVVGSQRWGRGRKYIRTSVLTDQYAQAGHIGDLTLFFAGGIPSFLAGNQAAVVLRTSGGTRRAWLGEVGTSRMAGTLLPSGGSSVATIETASSTGDHTWVLRLSGTSQTLWRDGVLFASGTQAANNFSDVSMLELSSTSFLEGANVNVYVAGWANIAWTDAQIEAFAENPAVLFGSRRALVATAGGGGPQIVAIVQASEADSAQAVAAAVGSVTSIGQASEANAAQALATRLSKAIGQAAETDAAQAIAAMQRKVLGQAAETDTAQAFASAQRKGIGQAAEADSAQPIVYSAPGAIGQAAETDAAQPFAAKQSRAIGQALETDAAQTITVRTGTTVTIGLALEIDTAGAFAALGPIAIAIGQAHEVDAARALTSIGGDVSIDPATIRRVARSPALTRLARSPAVVRSTNGL